MGPGLKRSPLTTGSRHRPASEYEEETLQGSRCLPVSFLNRRELPAQPELGDEGPVASHIFPSKVVEQTTAATHHLKEAPARSVVATELLQVFGQVRDALREHLDKREIETGIYYPLGLHEQKCFAYLGYKKGDFAETERAARETLALPIYPEISREAQRYVVDAIAEFYGSQPANQPKTT